MEQAEEFAEQLSDQWSHRSTEQSSLPPLPDAAKQLLEATGQQFVSDIRRFVGELEIGEAIARAQELTPWPESNSQYIPAPLAFALYSELIEIKGKQVRRASSDAERRVYLAEVDLLFRKVQDEQHKF
jgi:hypothetical protein